MSLNLNHNFNNRSIPIIKVKEGTLGGEQQPILTYVQSSNPISSQNNGYILQQHNTQAPTMYENPPSVRQEYYQEVYVVTVPVRALPESDSGKKKKVNKSPPYNLLYSDSRRESLYGASANGNKLKFSFDFGSQKVNHVMVKLDYFLDDVLVVLPQPISKDVYNGDVFFDDVESDNGQGHLRVTYEKDKYENQCKHCHKY
jgi:hypothetical protein